MVPEKGKGRWEKGGFSHHLHSLGVLQITVVQLTGTNFCSTAALGWGQPQPTITTCRERWGGCPKWSTANLLCQLLLKSAPTSQLAMGDKDSSPQLATEVPGQWQPERKLFWHKTPKFWLLLTNCSSHLAHQIAWKIPKRQVRNFWSFLFFYLRWVSLWKAKRSIENSSVLADGTMTVNPFGKFEPVWNRALSRNKRKLTENKSRLRNVNYIL